MRTAYCRVWGANRRRFAPAYQMAPGQNGRERLTALLTQRAALRRDGGEFESIYEFASRGMVPFWTRTESLTTKAEICRNPQVCNMLKLVATRKERESRLFTARPR